MNTLVQDIRHAAKMFRENPGFTAAAIAALAVGIGVNTAIFSVFNAVLLKPVPFPGPDRLVFVLNSQSGNPGGAAASPAKFMHYRAQTDVLEDVTAIRTVPVNYTAGDIPEQITAGTVSDTYFDLLRAPFAAGRGFAPGEDLPGAPRTVVLSYGFWQQRLGGDPDIIGRTISLSGNAHTVIGIAAPGFDVRELGEEPDVWVPFTLDPNTTDQGHYFRTIARLGDGVTLEQAQDRLEASAAAYRERFPIALGENGGFSVLPIQDAVVRNARGRLYTLFGAVALVLLIACANVANLLLVRATGRQREIAIRASLGAGRWRIVRQLLTESVMLSLAGGALGLVVGFLGMRALLNVSTAGLPRLGDAGALFGMDWRVVVFTLGLSLATGVLFGLVPAIVSSRTDLNTVIKDTSSRAGGGFRQNKTRSVLVALEVALAVVLVIGAGLLIRTTLALGAVDPGFSVDDVVTMNTSFSGPRFVTTDSVAQAQTNVLERIRSIPGVEAAVATCCVPLQGGYGLPFNVIGRQDEGPFTGNGGILPTTPGYFETFEIPVLAGRVFTDRDDGLAPPVVVVNQAMVDRFWADGGNPLDDRLLIGGGAGNMKELAEEPVRQIVGVVGSIRANGIANDPGPMMYIPHAQMPDALNALMQDSGPVAWIVRTRGAPASLSSVIQEEVRQATGLPVTNVQLMRDVVSRSTSQQRANMLLMTVFGGAAFVLAAIGIYGLMAYSVQQRTQEIGIRMALGADAENVRRMVVRQGMLLVAAGIVAGLVAAFFLAKVLAAALYGVEPRDLAVFASVPAALALVALAAVALPALRAGRVDPLEALRYE
jgi:putative ABC transport system permease protein